MITSNCSEIANRYNKRANSMRNQTQRLPQEFTLILHQIRKQNIQKLIYQKTPYGKDGSKGPSRKLMQGERFADGSVYNTEPYFNKRTSMTGGYKKNPGISREARISEISIVEMRPLMIRKLSRFNGRVLNVG